MNAADLLTILKLNALTENEALQVLVTLEGQMVARARYDKTLNKRRASVPYWARWRARTGVEGRVIWRRLTPAQPGQKLVTEEGCGSSWTMALLAVLASHPALVRYPLGTEAQDAVEALYKQLHEVKEGAPTKKPTEAFVSSLSKHADHGGGDEDGPDESDCKCRGTEEQADCAREGCGFCSAAERHTPKAEEGAAT